MKEKMIEIVYELTWKPPEPAWIESKPFVNVYTLAQLLAVRRETIDECAKVCMNTQSPDPRKVAVIGDAAHYIECADAIRKLKD